MKKIYKVQEEMDGRTGLTIFDEKGDEIDHYAYDMHDEDETFDDVLDLIVKDYPKVTIKIQIPRS